MVQFEFSKQHKVPHPYSRADECARSLTGVRDDDVLVFQTVPLPRSCFASRASEPRTYFESSSGLSMRSTTSVYSNPMIFSRKIPCRS